MLDDVQTEILDCIIDTNRDRIHEILDDWIIANGHKEVINKLLNPVLREMGNLWQIGNYKGQKISLAHGYMAGKIAEDFLKILENIKKTDENRPKKGTVIMGNIEDDFHSLGRKMVNTFLKTDNWNVIDLGNDILAKDFVDAAIQYNAKIIGVSAMMYSTAMNIKKLRTEIDVRGYKNKIMLAVGGAIFNLRPELIKEVGADGSSENAIDVPVMFTKLLLNKEA